MLKQSTKKSQNQLLEKALSFLATRARSESEVIKRLERETISREEIESITDHLKELGFIDDYKFATWFTNARVNSNRKGLRLIRLELLHFGVDSEIIDQVLGEVSNEDLLEQAKVLLTKKKSTFDKQGNLAKRKAYEYLFRRGYDTKIIASAVDEVFSKQ